MWAAYRQEPLHVPNTSLQVAAPRLLGSKESAAEHVQDVNPANAWLWTEPRRL